MKPGGALGELIHLMAGNYYFQGGAQQALEPLAEELRIEKMDVSIFVSGDSTPARVRESFTLFDAHRPCREDAPLEKRRPMADGAEAAVRVFPALDASPWTEEEKASLITVIDLFLIHFERTRLVEHAQSSALTQYMSGLPNSGGYLKLAAELLATRDAKQYDAYYLNLKGTSVLNIKFGQSEADEVIKRYAHALKAGLTKDELLGHLGGDSFVALVRKEHADAFLLKLKGVDTFAMRGGLCVSVTILATAGVMRINEDLPGMWSLIAWPSIAWQNAKASGESIVYLTDEMVEHYNRARLVENTFYNALEAGEFKAYYQPKVDMRTGRIIGAEVLARWVNGDRVIPPMDFIPELEHTEKIADLDLYILEEACRDMSAWRKKGNNIVPLSVNISRRDVAVPGMARRIAACIQRCGVRREDIIVEITETANEHENVQMMDFVKELQELNILTSIDDFGTGYSSLSFLRDFPVRELKIDRSFINHPRLQDKDKVIVGSMIDMAKRLNMNIITEGVETQDQVDFLLELGCSRAQGFLFDKPLPREEFEVRLRKGFYPIAREDNAPCKS